MSDTELHEHHVTLNITGDNYELILTGPLDGFKNMLTHLSTEDFTRQLVNADAQVLREDDQP